MLQVTIETQVFANTTSANHISQARENSKCSKVKQDLTATQVMKLTKIVASLEEEFDFLWKLFPLFDDNVMLRDY